MHKSNRDYKTMGKRIAVDFDGTITDDSPYPIMGKLRKYCKEAMQALAEHGYTLTLWTCRTGHFLTEAIDFIYANNLPIEIPQPAVGKIEADIYIDDRNPWKKEIDWQEIERSILDEQNPKL